MPVKEAVDIASLSQAESLRSMGNMLASFFGKLCVQKAVQYAH